MDAATSAKLADACQVVPAKARFASVRMLLHAVTAFVVVVLLYLGTPKAVFQPLLFFVLAISVAAAWLWYVSHRAMFSPTWFHPDGMMQNHSKQILLIPWAEVAGFTYVNDREILELHTPSRTLKLSVRNQFWQQHGPRVRRWWRRAICGSGRRWVPVNNTTLASLPWWLALVIIYVFGAFAIPYLGSWAYLAYPVAIAACSALMVTLATAQPARLLLTTQKIEWRNGFRWRSMNWADLRSIRFTPAEKSPQADLKLQLRTRTRTGTFRTSQAGFSLLIRLASKLCPQAVVVNQPESKTIFGLLIQLAELAGPFPFRRHTL